MTNAVSNAIPSFVPSTPPTKVLRQRFRVLTFKEVEQLPDPEWLVKDILPAKSLAILYGPPGAGKTFLALDVALSVASASDWAGHPTTPGAVVYIVAEGVAGLSKRLKAWGVVHGVSDVSRVYLVPDAPQLAQGTDVEHLLRDLQVQIPEPISLVIIDTLARCFLGGDENSAKDVGKLIAGADRLRKKLDCAVLLVHHTTKKGDAERGSSALRGAPETMMSVDLDSGLLTLTCEKQKDAASFAPVRLRLRPVSGSGSCVVEPAGARSTYGKPLQCLGVLAEHPGGLTATEWHEASGMSDTTFFRHRGQLESDGLIAKENHRYSLTERGRAELTPTSNVSLAG